MESFYTSKDGADFKALNQLEVSYTSDVIKTFLLHNLEWKSRSDLWFDLWPLNQGMS